jgi:hypothetical protein
MLNHFYRESQLIHPYGYALYEPQSSKVVRPGALGYIDPENGHFVPLIGAQNKLVDLTDTTVLQENRLSPPDNLILTDVDNRSWGPKISSQVQRKQIDIKTYGSGVIDQLKVMTNYKLGQFPQACLIQ